METDTTTSIGTWRKEQFDRARQERRDAARRRLNEYDAPEYGIAELAELRIDERYQRARVEAKVHTLLAHFEPNACQPLAVSIRADGSRYLVDGQHRAAVLTDIGIKSWPALIYRNLARRDEAAMWAELNTRQTKPRPPERFRAALERKDPEALAVAGVVEAAGFRLCLRRRAVKVSGDHIEAIDAVLRIFRQSRDPGLRDVLALVRRAWPDPDETQRTARLVLLGLAAFLAGSWAPRIDAELAVTVIGRYNPGVWMAKTRGVTTDDSPTRLFCNAIRTAYNKKAARGRRL